MSINLFIMAATPANTSLPTGKICSFGRTNPELPLSGSSIVNEYRIPAPPCAQSSLPPVTYNCA